MMPLERFYEVEIKSTWLLKMNNNGRSCMKNFLKSEEGLSFVSTPAGVYKRHNRANDMHSRKLRRGRGMPRLSLCMLSKCIPRNPTKGIAAAGQGIGYENACGDVCMPDRYLT